MMKKTVAILLLIVLCVACMCSCKQSEDSASVTFGSKVVTDSFDGLGVEWGTYEDTSMLAEGAWERIITAVDKLNPSLVRCMTNLDWFVTKFDNKKTADLTDDTWEYNFNNKWMENAAKVLDYCQAHSIKVAFGVWNVIGNADLSDDYGMIKNGSADPRWAEMTSDLMCYLIKEKRYTCIRWFVNTNEPNVIGRKGESKNAYSTVDIWMQGMRNVREAFDKVGLEDLSIVGGDTTTFVASKLYLEAAASNISDILDNYGVHLYVNNSEIASGTYESNVRALYKAIKSKDNQLGKSKQMHIWEAGLLTGKNTLTDCNEFIMNYSYGLRMADYTIQSLNGGINGIVYWDLDDAMHFMYKDTGNTAKEWGMFSTLATADIKKQEYRPWYHSSVLLTNVLRPGNVVYGCDSNPDGVRSLATVNPERTKGGIVVVNNSSKKIHYEMVLNEQIKTDGKLYIYLYNETALRIGSDGFVVPNYVIDGSLNSKLSLEIPASTMVVVSTEEAIGA